MTQVLAILLDAGVQYGTTDRIILVLAAIGIGALLLLALLGAWRRP